MLSVNLVGHKQMSLILFNFLSSNVLIYLLSLPLFTDLSCVLFGVCVSDVAVVRIAQSELSRGAVLFSVSPVSDGTAPPVQPHLCFDKLIHSARLQHVSDL